RRAGRKDRRAPKLQPRLRRLGRVRGRSRQHVVADWSDAGRKKRRRNRRAQASGDDPPAQDRRAQNDPRRSVSKHQVPPAHRSLAVIHRAAAPTPSGGISVTNNAFSPGTKTVAVGATVQWSWNTCSNDPYNYGGQTCVAHSVTFDDGTTSPTQDQGTFNRMFTAAGTYNYHCSVHGAAMAGTITVQ